MKCGQHLASFNREIIVRTRMMVTILVLLLFTKSSFGIKCQVRWEDRTHCSVVIVTETNLITITLRQGLQD